MPRKFSQKIHQSSSGSSVSLCWIRIPIKAAKGRRLRVLIYARFSTDEQDPSSIQDQVDYCIRFLKDCGIEDYEITVIVDEGLSGELVSRPGIDQVIEGIKTQKWDLILAEDVSRLYRHETACGELFELAVDEGLRIICCNEFLDTAQEDWPDRLRESMRHHAKANYYTSYRIKRKHEGLWKMGAAIGQVKPGYYREPSRPATERQSAEGPFFDHVDPKWAPIIREGFERIAGNDAPELVAKFLDEVGLPKMSNAQLDGWTAKNVKDLIRRPDYRGFQTYRNTFSKKIHRSGKRHQVRNESEEVLTRDMPHLRIVPDAIWYQANAAIDARNHNPSHSNRSENPLTGVPRGSYGPLSNKFYCRCGGKMHMGGRATGGYRCQHVKARRCWNRASSSRELTHAAIKTALINTLNGLKPNCEAMAERVRKLADDKGERDRRKKSLEAKKKDLEIVVQNLLSAIEKPTEQIDALVKRLANRDEELAKTCADLEGLQRTQFCVPTAPELSRRIDEIIELLEPMDRTVQPILQQLITPIEAIPVRQFGTEKVVLRARFGLKTSGIMPPVVLASLIALRGDSVIETTFETIPLTVDFYEPSTGPKYGLTALELKAQGLGLTAIGKSLGISKRRANIAVQYGQQLKDAGLSEPFIELIKRPATASRWRYSRRDGE